MKSLLPFCLLLLSAGVSQAQQNQSPDSLRTQELREVQIVAPYRATAETPVSFKNITLETIEQRNVGQEPGFLLQQTPSMTVNSDAGSYYGYTYLRLRGIDQTRLNVTLNGVPLSEPEDQGAYFNNFPDFLNSVESLQIQRGVGTSANGVASYAGSLNFESMSLTRKQAEIGVGIGSYGSNRVYAEYGSGLKNKQAFYVRASNVHSDGYKERSRHDGQSVFYSYGYLGDRNILKITGFVGRQKNLQSYLGAPLDSIRVNPRYNANGYEPDKFLQSHTQAQFSHSFNSATTLTSALYYTFLNGNYDFDLNNFLGLPSTQELYNYAFRSHLVGVSSVFSTEVKNLRLDAGVHGNLYQRQHLGSERVVGFLYKNTGFKNEASAFVKGTYKLGALSLFGDAQYRYAEFIYDGSVELPELRYNFLNPRVGLTYQFAPSLSGYYSIGKTSREPTRNDLFQGSDDLPADENGNPVFANLPAESVVDQEVGVKLNSSWGHAYVNGYYMDFKNEIVLNGKVGPNGLPLNSNAAKSYRTGIEFDLEYNIGKNVRLQNNSVISKNRITEEGVSFRPVLSPAVIVNQDVSYRAGKAWFGLNARYQGLSYIDYANEAKLPSFFVLGASATYTWNHFELGLKLNNLTNHRYYTSGLIAVDGRPNYNIQAPLNYFATVKYSF